MPPLCLPAWLGSCRLTPASGRALHCCTSSCPELGAWRSHQEVRSPFWHFLPEVFIFCLSCCVHSATVSNHHMAPSASSRSPRYLPKSQCLLNSLLTQPFPLYLLHTRPQCPKEVFPPFSLFTIANFAPISFRFV